jgi:hypothetical protein
MTAENLLLVLALNMQPAATVTQRYVPAIGHSGTSTTISLKNLPAPPNWLPNVLERLEELLALGDEWSSYGEPPSHECDVASRQLLVELFRAGVCPSKLIPMADGGISFRFHQEERTARIAVGNDASIVLVTQQSPEDAATYRELESATAADELAVFLD